MLHIENVKAWTLTKKETYKEKQIQFFKGTSNTRKLLTNRSKLDPEISNDMEGEILGRYFWCNFSPH